MKKHGNKVSLLSSKAIDEDVEIENRIIVKYIKSKHIHRYSLNLSASEYAIFPYNKFGVLYSRQELQREFPMAYRYLSKKRVKEILLARENGRFSRTFWQYSRPQNMKIIFNEKLITPFNAFSCSFAKDDRNDFLFSAGVTGAYGIILKEDAPFFLEYLLGILNSKVIFTIIKSISTCLRGGYYSFENKYIKKLPIPLPSKTLSKAIESRVIKILALKKKNPDANISALEIEIDQLVYQLYGLTQEEIAIVEDKSV